MQPSTTIRHAVQSQPLVASLLLVALLAVLLAGCSTPAPIRVDTNRLVQRTPLDVEVGARIALVGYAPDAVTIADDSVVRLLPPAATAEAQKGETPQTLLVAERAGTTDLTVAQSLCSVIAASCGEPALYYRLQIDVR